MLRQILLGLFVAAFIILQNGLCVAVEMSEEWNPPSAGPITAWTAPLCGKSKFVIHKSRHFSTCINMRE